LRGRVASSGESFLLAGHLTYLPILTKVALEVAPSRGNGEAAAARLKVKQGFFFNRVNGRGTDGMVVQGIQFTFYVTPHPTDSHLSFFNAAAKVAQAALHLLMLKGLP